MTRDEAIKFYRKKWRQARSVASEDVYADILDILKNQPDPLAVVKYRLENAHGSAQRIIYRRALRELNI